MSSSERDHLPAVALVGRPNVGKSTLFNKLVGFRKSLVFDTPGVTRDRLFGLAHMDGHCCHIIDTGGFELKSDDPFLAATRVQTEIAISEADLLLMVVDGRAGLQGGDEDVLEQVRRSGKPFAVVVNKVDTAELQEQTYEFHALGVDSLILVSAEHKLGLGELEEYLLEQLDMPSTDQVATRRGPVRVRDEEPEEGEVSRIEWEQGVEPLRVAVVGKPNVGKSSLINALAGNDRVLASSTAGTTRDAIDVSVHHEGQEFIFVDTAGMRRKKMVVDKVEHYSVMLARRSIEKSDVTVIVLNATEMPSEQDLKIASLAHRLGKGVCIVANQWDRIENPEWKESFAEQVESELNFVRYAKLIQTSAKTKTGIRNIMPAVLKAQQERHRRIATSELNRFFRSVVEMRPPPTRGAKRPVLYYCTQPHVRPPTFIFVAKHPDMIADGYARFLRNQLRAYFDFEGTPLWLKFRPKDRKKGGGKVLDQ